MHNQRLCQKGQLKTNTKDRKDKAKTEDMFEIDYTVGSWQEIGTLAFFAGLVGFTLSVLLYLVVAL